MITYSITQENKNHELKVINEILTNNHYQHITNQNQYSKPQKQQHTTTKTEKWATFTHHGPETRIITKLFKNTNIRTAFKTNNTIKNHLKPKN
jgi:glycine cleavage system aminomethyltransferase T